MKQIISFVLLSIFLTLPVYAAQPASIKIFVQWAQSTPNDWTLVDSSVWPSQPTKADPVGDVSLAGIGIGDSLLNNQKGWVFAVNVQGVIFNFYDHYAVTSDAAAVTVTAWRDDPILFPIGTRQADVGIFKPLKFDANVGQDNTDQSFILYREGTQYDNLIGHVPSNTTVLHYSDFVAPNSSDTKPGIYTSDAKFQQHLDAETLKGWR